MRRTHPFLSPIGLVFCILMFMILGFEIWRNGGIIFDPGPLSAQAVAAQSQGVQNAVMAPGSYHSHQEFEKECWRCHQPLQTVQSVLCLNCHTKLAAEIASKTGVHSEFDPKQSCASCHPDHRGRAFDMVAAGLNEFNHTKTSFSLVHHTINYDATPMDCAACHDAKVLGYPFKPNTCVNCHGQHDLAFMTQHITDFELNCTGCHDGKDSLVSFDHQNSSLPLTGAHLKVNCAGCHKTTNFKETPIQCSHCHAEPDSHKGVFGQACSDCHTTTYWMPATLKRTS